MIQAKAQPEISVDGSLAGWNWHEQIEPRLRAAALHRTISLTEMLALRAPQLRPAMLSIADGYAVFHGSGAMSSFAREVGTTRSITDHELEAVEHFYSKRSCSVRFWTSDLTRPGLLEMLGERRYTAIAHSVNWVSALDETPSSRECPEIEVLPVGRDLYETWVTAVVMGFCEDNRSLSFDEIPVSHVDLFFASGCAPDDQTFLARIRGEYVGAGVLNITDGIAMLRTASTRFAHRNRGVQQALLATRLKCARDQGARIAVSQSPPSGPSAHNLEKFGFRVFRRGSLLEKATAH